MVDAALDKLFGALDTKGGKVLDAEMMRFLGKAILGTMPSAEAAKKELGLAAGSNAKSCTKEQFLKLTKGGLAKCKDQGDAKIVVDFWTKRVKNAQRRAKEAAAKKS
eukprot:g750.t1